MRNRWTSLFLILTLMVCVSAEAQPAKAKKVVKKVAAKKVTAPVRDITDEKLADLREDMNKALAELKGATDKVKSDNSDAKVGGVIFFRWQKYLSNGGTTPNNFDVERAYLDFKKKLAGDSSVRVTLDVRRLSNSSPTSSTQNLFDYLKYAYYETPVPIPGYLKPVPLDLTAKIGLQHTCWIDWADKMLNLRFIAKSLLDNEGVMSSSDFGVGAIGKFTLPGMPETEYHATLLNGSGYSAAETDKKKDLGLRLNSTVYDGAEMGKVILGVFGNIKGVYTDDLDGTTRQLSGMLGYKQDLGTAYVEYLYGTGISGYSLGGIVTVLPGTNLFARLDQYDPNRSRSNDQINRSFYGATYDWNKDIKLAADIQSSQTGSGSTTNIFYLHSQVII